jgi:hypothetical protein
VTVPGENRSAFLQILQRLEAAADSLGEGSAADHVRRSVRELSAAVQHGDSVGQAVERVMSSVRQLEAEERAGRLRHARAALPVAERLLVILQGEVLPVLQRSGRM